MWGELEKELTNFSSAVLAGIDNSGYPFSIRCKFEIDSATQVLRVQIPNYVRIRPGPAGLLCHKHDELLWNLKSFTLRGILERDLQGWLFRPQKFVPGAGIGGVMAMVKFVRDGKRSTRQYLDKHHMTRPILAWDTVHTIWAEIKEHNHVNK